jgi:uncharacterized ferritin-like protein (DUF455 family)
MVDRDYAVAILFADSLDAKLAPPPRLDDERPGQPRRVDAPVRPAGLTISPAREVKVPPIAGMRDRSQRIRILHALANHELQAAELFAWALLAFPDAPAAFRRGLLNILADEQRHCRLYIDRLTELGARFGELPVTGHFWNQLGQVTTPLRFVCAMGLTFENANLDFAQDYAEAARDAGDDATARALDVVHRDEIRHVGFAWQWMLKLAPGKPAWPTYLANIDKPLGPERARGKRFDRASRVAAGMDAQFIAALAAARAVRPNGAPR